jgi:hypothetical protein
MVGPVSSAAGSVLWHPRFRNPRPTKRTAAIMAIITAIRARDPCDSVMVNDGLELITNVLM